LAHEILAHRKVPLFKLGLSDYRIAIPTTLMLDNLSDTVRHAWERSLHQLTQAGARLTEIKLPEINDLSSLLATGGFSAAESFTWHRHFLAKSATDYDPRIALRIERGAHMKAYEYLELQQARASWIRQMQQAMLGYDVMLSPTVPITSPTIASMAPGPERDEAFFKANGLLLRNTSVVNMLDGCALSMPCHQAGELPVSLMVWQGAMTDDVVLNVSLAIEQQLKLNA
jgi:amidase/aspartyl-tRNA(Asn)/glutamyl-tRNA(Gln) amidotransferase subunit A